MAWDQENCLPPSIDAARPRAAGKACNYVNILPIRAYQWAFAHRPSIDRVVPGRQDDRRFPRERPAEVASHQVGRLEHVPFSQKRQDLQVLGALDTEPLMVDPCPILEEPA